LNLVRAVTDRTRWGRPSRPLFHYFEPTHSCPLFHTPQVIGELRIPGSSKGVSRSQIKSALPDTTAARINVALKKAVDAGKLIQIKDSFKVAKPVKKVVVKKATVKKVVKKKPAKKTAKKVRPFPHPSALGNLVPSFISNPLPPPFVHQRGESSG
jgi:hypothetical protein